MYCTCQFSGDKGRGSDHAEIEERRISHVSSWIILYSYCTARLDISRNSEFGNGKKVPLLSAGFRGFPPIALCQVTVYGLPMCVGGIKLGDQEKFGREGLG